MDYFVTDRADYADAAAIINSSISAANPEKLVFDALKSKTYAKPPCIIAIGKAAAGMAAAAKKAVEKIDFGLVLTKYGHADTAPIDFTVYEAGHPVLDENSCKATEEILKKVENLKEEDTVILLLSGGGSSLFEKPLISLDRLKEITEALLKKGATITELNCIRKRLSAVKGGRFAKACQPARVEVYALSDVLGDVADVIASGPASVDSLPTEEVGQIIKKYEHIFKADELALLKKDLPKSLDNSSMQIIGNLEILCKAAKEKALELGYTPYILTLNQEGEAKGVGRAMAYLAASFKRQTKAPLALIIGGETTVTVTGKGKGGRNQEIALSAAKYIEDLEGVQIFSVGSDGTDGPTDAAGGIAGGNTANILAEKGISIDEELANNNSYHALKSCGGLIVTGPTGTNVNDLSMILIKEDFP